MPVPTPGTIAPLPIGGAASFASPSGRGRLQPGEGVPHGSATPLPLGDRPSFASPRGRGRPQPGEVNHQPDEGVLCAVHAWHGRRLRPADAVEPLADQLFSLLAELSDDVTHDTNGNRLLRWGERLRRGSTIPPDIASRPGCSFCATQPSIEAALAARVTAETLCVPHLRVAAQQGDGFAAVRLATRQSWRTIEEQLDEFIRKHDYRFQREPRGDEQGSPHWAIELVAGVEGVR